MDMTAAEIDFEIFSILDGILHFRGLSVAFGVKHKDKKYYMCCTEDMQLYFKKGDLPNDIGGNRSDVIFFQKEFCEDDGGFKFQSALKSGYYLAVSNEGGTQKLVLQESKSFSEKEKFNLNWS
ncbi:unnamed protein product [Ranitomeya imitator]|uniref:Interleukin-18 n=1 Tax=Ranitomeya imitator TaxID=111125 RepID=A0ABN9M1P4_9NEOB|nr:unnamed protein product [Ranitomeya imitator]